MQSNFIQPKLYITQYNYCCCCGIPLEKGRKKYCSKKCKEEFIFKLNWFTNLLRAINTKYASFFFTQEVLILNVLPVDSTEVYSYFFKRTPGKRPTYDMENMLFLLSETWWNNLKHRRCRDKACREVLKKGNTHILKKDLLIPKTRISIECVAKDLTRLKINKRELITSSDPHSILKKAYKICALKSHPDTGGDEKSFITMYNSYQKILLWLKNPNYSKRRGINGHWFYDGAYNNWYPPL